MAQNPEEIQALEDELADATAAALEEEAVIRDDDSEFDLMFPTIPLVDDDSPPEDADALLVDDLADFAEDELDDDPEEEFAAAQAQVGDDVAMDWEVLELYGTESGEVEVVSGEGAVLEWLLKGLNTERGRYAIYSDTYGTRLHALIGQGLPDAILYAEISREVEDFCLSHPRVLEATVDAIEPIPNLAADARLVTITVRLDTSEDPIQLDLTL